MTMTEQDEARERLLEILLEEEFGRRSAQSLAPRAAGSGTPMTLRVLLAALLLLGTGVVVGVFWLQRDREAGYRWANLRQDPADPSLVMPRDLSHFLELLQRAEAMSLAQQDVIGAGRVASASGSVDQLDMVARPGSMRIEGVDLERWRQELRSGLGERADQYHLDVVIHLDVLLPDDKRVRCLVTLDDSGVWCGVDDGDPFVVSPGLRQLLRDTHAALERRYRQEKGLVAGVAELAALPADQARIDCPVAPDDAFFDQLLRFGQLQHLRLRGDPSAAMLTGLAALPALQELDLDGAALDADRISALATLRQLRVLVLRRCRGVDRVALRSLRTLSVLHTLHCIDTPLGVGCEGLEGLVSLPALREFGWRLQGLAGGRGRFEALLRTKLNRLLLVDLGVTRDELVELGGLPTLSDLVLVGPLRDHELQGVEAIETLRRLRLRNTRVTPDGIDELRLHLPDCAIDWRFDARWFDTAYAFER